MAKPNISILVGCNELCVTEALRILLGNDETSIRLTERASFAEFVSEACKGGYDAVIVYGKSSIRWPSSSGHSNVRRLVLQTRPSSRSSHVNIVDGLSV